MLQRVIVGRFTQSFTRGWWSALGSAATRGLGSQTAAWLLLANIPGVKQPARGVALVAAANFSTAHWPGFLEDMTPASARFSVATMARAAGRSFSQVLFSFMM